MAIEDINRVARKKPYAPRHGTHSMARDALLRWAIDMVLSGLVLAGTFVGAVVLTRWALGLPS